MLDDRVKHLEFIQAAITRLSGHSFLVKGWSITLTAALFVLASKDQRPSFSFVILYPALVFWGLDAYFLRQERLFRKLYDSVRQQPTAQEGSPGWFSLETANIEPQVPGFWSTLFAPTIGSFHSVVVIVVLLLASYFIHLA